MQALLNSPAGRAGSLAGMQQQGKSDDRIFDGIARTFLIDQENREFFRIITSGQ